MADNTLPIHPTTGLRALGVTRRGPIWPVLGGNGEGDGNTGDDTGSDADADADGQQDESATDTDQQQTDEDEQLGEGGKKALAAERKARAAAEKRLAALEDAQKKADRAKLDDTAKAQAERDDARKEAEAAKAEAALLRAAVKHGLSKEDLELLDGVPADQIDERAKKLAARIKISGTPGSSGGEASGDRKPKKPTTLAGAIGAHYGSK
ncbi:hypothetical protein [Gordonia sp. NPDC003376]